MDGQPVGNAGAAKVLGVNRKRIIMWLRDKEKLKSKINANPKLTKVKRVHAGVTASTADIEEVLNDYINKHRGCGSNEVMNKLLELKPDTLAGCQPLRGRRRRWLPATNSNAGTNVSASGAGSVSAGVPACVKKKGPVAFSLSTLRNMICAVLGYCGTEQDFYRRLGFGTVRNLLVSVGFQQLY